MATLPPKPRSGYFLFADDVRAAVKAEHEGATMGEMGKAIGARWHALSEEERAAYNARAEAMKQAWAAAVGSLGTGGAEGEGDEGVGGEEGVTGSVLPLARVRRVMQLDPDMGTVSKEALTAIAVATELFIAALVEDAVDVAQGHKRKTVNDADITTAIHRQRGMAFLRADFPLDAPHIPRRASPAAGSPPLALPAAAEHDTSTDQGGDTSAPAPPAPPSTAASNPLAAMFARVAADPSLQRQRRDEVAGGGGGMGGAGETSPSATAPHGASPPAHVSRGEPHKEGSKGRGGAPSGKGKPAAAMAAGSLNAFLVRLTPEQAAAAKEARLAAMAAEVAATSAARGESGGGKRARRDMALGEDDEVAVEGEAEGEEEEGGAVSGSVLALKHRILQRKGGASVAGRGGARRRPISAKARKAAFIAAEMAEGGGTGGVGRRKHGAGESGDGDGGVGGGNDCRHVAMDEGGEGDPVDVDGEEEGM